MISGGETVRGRPKGVLAGGGNSQGPEEEAEGEEVDAREPRKGGTARSGKAWDVLHGEGARFQRDG